MPNVAAGLVGRRRLRFTKVAAKLTAVHGSGTSQSTVRCDGRRRREDATGTACLAVGFDIPGISALLIAECANARISIA